MMENTMLSAAERLKALREQKTALESQLKDVNEEIEKADYQLACAMAESETPKYWIVVDFYDREDLTVYTEATTLGMILGNRGITLADGEVPSVDLWNDWLAADMTITVDKYSYAAEDIRQIVRIQMGILQKMLEREGVELSWTPSFEDYMTENGYDPDYGARPVKRLIQRELVNQLATAILDGTVRKDSAIVADAADGKVLLRNA